MKNLTVLLITCLNSGFSIAQEFTDSAKIYFDFDKHQLRASERSRLDSVISDYKNGLIEDGIVVKGHTDIVGSVPYNDLLARKRTFTVHEYLLNNGIPKTAVSIESFGERNPVNANRTKMERQLNRRVELIWTWTTVSSDTVAPIVPEPEKETPKQPVKDFSKEAIDTVKTGDVLRLRNINFYGGRHTFMPSAAAALKELLEVMRSNPTLVIEIQGHICCRPGSTIDGADFDAGNNYLSHNRAKAVFQYLVDNGIDEKRMTYRGFAGAHPLVYPEYTEADREANRRVEIKIISK